MADVVFAIGSRPRLLRHEALELADLLNRRRTPAANSASRNIGVQAELDQEAADVLLDRNELSELHDVLKEPRYGGELASFTRLRDEIAAELSGR